MKAGFLLLFMMLPLCGAARADVLELDPSNGTFRVLLFKEGLLKVLGHDHAVEVRDYKGHIELWASSATISLEVSADSLEIDSPQARREEGFTRKLSDADRAKIRETMRGDKGLEVKRFPLMTFRSTRIEPVDAARGIWMVSGEFTLHGVKNLLSLPVTLSEKPGGYGIAGYVWLRPTDYGIKPFKAAGGFIRVRDEALVHFDFAAQRKERTGQ